MNDTYYEPLNLTPDYWIDRYNEQGRDYVANRHLANFESQHEMICEVVESHLGNYKFKHALDFGAGVGRFQDLINRHAKSVWAVDVVPDALQELNKGWPNTKTSCDIANIASEQFDFVWTCVVLQHIGVPEKFTETCQHLCRVAKPNAKFILVENAVDYAPHVAKRTPEDYRSALNLKLDHYELLSIDKPESHWLIVGCRSD